MRGAEHVRAIRAVLAAFGEHADQLVFVGGCVLGLYARAEGPPLQMTEDVDCISSLSPWSRQAKILADLCYAGVIVPDEALMARSDLPDLVAWHLDRRDAAHAVRVVRALDQLAGAG